MENVLSCLLLLNLVYRSVDGVWIMSATGADVRSRHQEYAAQCCHFSRGSIPRPLCFPVRQGKRSRVGSPLLGPPGATCESETCAGRIGRHRCIDVAFHGLGLPPSGFMLHARVSNPLDRPGKAGPSTVEGQARLVFIYWKLPRP